MRTTIAQRIGAIAGAAITLCSCSIFERPPILDFNDPDYGYEKVMTIQVCLPNKEAFFEDVKVDLSGVPESMPFLDFRKDRVGWMYRNRYWPSAPQPIAKQGDTDIARRWLPGAGTRPIPRYFLAFEEVLERQGRLSDSADHIYLASSTIRNQPVFEQETRHLKKEFIAFSTTVEVEQVTGQKDWVKYWFKMPETVPVNSFSAWLKPVSQEDQNSSRRPAVRANWYRLTHGAEMIIYPVDEDAPRMRVMQITFKDRHDAGRFAERTREAISKTGIWKQYTKIAGENIRFVPKASDPIPACD